MSPELTATLDAIRKKIDAARQQAKFIHESPTLFLDRDHQVMALQCKASGMEEALGIVLHEFIEKKTIAKIERLNKAAKKGKKNDRKVLHRRRVRARPA